MTERRRIYWLSLPFLALVLAVLACGTGFSTSTTIYGLSGRVRAQMKEANGVYTNSLEIDEDWIHARINASVSFSVSEGSCQATLSGGENSSITVSATADNPGEASGTLVTDAFGDVDLETDCQEAKELDLLVEFTQD